MFRSTFAVSRLILALVFKRRPVVGPDLNRAAAVGLGGGDDVADVQARGAAEGEALGDPILQLLRPARLDDGHPQVFAEEPAVGGAPAWSRTTGPRRR